MRLFKITLLLTAVAVLGGCVTNPSTGRRQLLLLPASQVAAMGVQAKPQVTQEYGGEMNSPQVVSYVERVGRSLLTHVEPQYAGIDWEFTVLDSDVINAFALPGGKIFITRGLLARFDNEAQVAGVLGHEIGHVTARHVDERLSQTLIAQLGLSAIGAYSESELITQGGAMAAQGVLLKFGRDQESESDLQGLKYMTRAGYDPIGMRQVLEILLEASKGGGTPEFLSTHPHPETRIREIDLLLAGQYRQARGAPGYGLYPERFAAEAAPYLR